jgi:hypothetical protein
MHPKKFGPFKGPKNLLERYVLRMSGKNEATFSSREGFDERMPLHACHEPPNDNRIGIDTLRNEAGADRRSPLRARKYRKNMDPNDEPAAA